GQGSSRRQGQLNPCIKMERPPPVVGAGDRACSALGVMPFALCAVVSTLQDFKPRPENSPPCCCLREEASHEWPGSPSADCDPVAAHLRARERVLKRPSRQGPHHWFPGRTDRGRHSYLESLSAAREGTRGARRGSLTSAPPALGRQLSGPAGAAGGTMAEARGAASGDPPARPRH